MLGTGVGLLAGLALLFWVMDGAADSYELDNRILGMAFYGACAGAVVLSWTTWSTVVGDSALPAEGGPAASAPSWLSGGGPASPS